MPIETQSTVLVVDDEDGSRYAVGRMLKKAGLNVVEAACGQDALRRAKVDRPDIILLDVNLPDIDGYEVCRTLKADADTALIPVVHLSASYVRTEDRAFGLNQGAEGYLTHPVEEPVLVATINSFLRYRRAEDALRASEAKYRTLVSVIPGIIFTADARGQWTYANPPWSQYTGIAPAEATGDAWVGMLHPEESEHVTGWWRTVVAAGRAGDIEFRIRGADGDYRWFLCRVTPYVDDAGVAGQWYGSVTDISEQKRMEQSLHHALRTKDQFLAALSHELRTPLTPVLATAQAMEADPALPFETREAAALISRNVELEVRLIDDLLDTTRISSGKLRLDIRPVDAHEAIRHALTICLSEVGTKRIAIEQRLDARSPVVDADPVRLQQVLWNLAKNAVKFTPEQGHVRVLTADDPDGMLKIVVEDDGIGIPAASIPTIFDAFQQGGINTRQFGGLGLGLTISSAIVALLGGTLTADSGGAGKGSTFIVRLPVSKSPPRPPTTDPRPSDRGTLPGQPRHVLLVEDHPDTAKVMSHFLRSWGYRVRTAGTVADALLAAEQSKFDLVISDIGLPDGSGVEMIRHLLARQSVPAIALSGFGMDEDVHRAKAAGFTEHLIKPVSVANLRAVVGRVLSDAV